MSFVRQQLPQVFERICLDGSDDAPVELPAIESAQVRMQRLVVLVHDGQVLGVELLQLSLLSQRDVERRGDGSY